MSLCGAGPFPSPGTFGGFLQDAGNFPTLTRGEQCLLSQEEKGPFPFLPVAKPFLLSSRTLMSDAEV